LEFGRALEGFARSIDLNQAGWNSNIKEYQTLERGITTGSKASCILFTYRLIKLSRLDKEPGIVPDRLLLFKLLHREKVIRG